MTHTRIRVLLASTQVAALALLLAAIVGCPTATDSPAPDRPIPDTGNAIPAADDSAGGPDDADPVTDDPAGDTDRDGVPDILARCSDTLAYQSVDRNGCAVAADDDPVDDTDPVDDPDPDADEDPDADDDTGGAGDSGAGGGSGDGGGGGDGDGGTQTPVCGNSIIEPGEDCDPPDGQTCDDNCFLIQSGGPANDACQNPTSVGEGATSITTVNASTDGPQEDAPCDGFGIDADIWFCHTASCSGFLTVDLCASFYDTTLALYDGCACPSAAAIACNDDGCEFGLGSRLAIPVEMGDAILIRIGGFDADQGEATLDITCADEPDPPTPACGSSAEDCMTPHDTIGCVDAGCCAAVCDVDAICCTIGWDGICALEANGLCGDGFPTCVGAVGDCGTQHGTPGCVEEPCCNQVCTADPFCCVTEWDELCADAAANCP